MAFFQEADQEGVINIPVLGTIKRLDQAISGEGVGLLCETIVRSPDGEPAIFRIQMSNKAVQDALGLLLRYAEAANLEPTRAGEAKTRPVN